MEGGGRVGGRVLNGFGSGGGPHHIWEGGGGERRYNIHGGGVTY